METAGCRRLPTRRWPSESDLTRVLGDTGVSLLNFHKKLTKSSISSLVFRWRNGCEEAEELAQSRGSRNTVCSAPHRGPALTPCHLSKSTPKAATVFHEHTAQRPTVHAGITQSCVTTSRWQTPVDCVLCKHQDTSLRERHSRLRCARPE